MVPERAVHSSDSLEEQVEAVERTAAETGLAEDQRHKVAGMVVLARTAAEVGQTQADTGFAVDTRKVADTVDTVACRRTPCHHREARRILAVVGASRTPWDRLLAEHQHLGNPVAHTLAAEHWSDGDEPVRQE
jgi:uncharacterized protein (DUF3084 family)